MDLAAVLLPTLPKELYSNQQVPQLSQYSSEMLLSNLSPEQRQMYQANGSNGSNGSSGSGGSGQSCDALGPAFDPAIVWMQKYKNQVVADTSNEVRHGYPVSSYENINHLSPIETGIGLAAYQLQQIQSGTPFPSQST